MNHKLTLSLALVLSSTLAAYSTHAADTDSLRVVVKPSKTAVLVGKDFTVVLRVENPTATDQTVRVMRCSWEDQWKTSDTSITWRSWDCDKNFPVNVNIPAGGAYTNQLTMVVPKTIPETKRSFRMGFTPIDGHRTFWSDEVTLDILPPNPLLVGCTAALDPIDCLVANCSSNGWWLNGMAPILGLPEVASTAQVVSKVFQMTFFDSGQVKSYTIMKVRQVHIRGPLSDLYTALLVQTDLGKKIVLLKYEGPTAGWWSRVYSL